MTSSPPSIEQLSEWLVTNGASTAPVRVASRLLATAREHDWGRNPAALVSWLEALALDVARAWQTDDPEEPIGGGTPAVLPNAVTALGDLLEERVVETITTEDLRLASAVLGLASHNAWIEHPGRMAEWLQRLASEVAKPARS